MHSLVLCTLYISYSHQAEGSFNFYSGTLWHPHPLSSFSFTKRYHREFFLHRILSVFFIDITNWSKQQHYFYKICIAYGNICWVNHGIFHTVKKEILVELFGAQFQWTAERKHVTTKKQAPQFTGRSCALNNENLFSANAKKKHNSESHLLFHSFDNGTYAFASPLLIYFFCFQYPWSFFNCPLAILARFLDISFPLLPILQTFC